MFVPCSERLMATRGISLQLLPNTPRTFRTRPFNLDEDSKLFVQETLNDLAARNMIEPAGRATWVSQPFVVTQPSGKQRLCFDMSALGRALPKIHFKMEGLADARALTTPRSWFAKLDLKDAYHSLSIAPESRSLLSFPFRGTLWRWKRLPFGLSLAPVLFTRVVKKALSPLRAAGMSFVQYLDDILIVEESPAAVQKTVQAIVSTLVTLGFQINTTKSETTPSRVIEFLGLRLDAAKNSLSVPAEKLRKCRRDAKKLLQQQLTTPRQVAQVLGLLNSVAPAVRPGLLQQRWCQRALAQALKTSNWEAKFELSPEAKRELSWWSDELPHFNGRPLPLSSLKASWRITTDASETGWGVVTPSGTIRGHWTPEQSRQSSNWREMWAATYAIEWAAARRPNSTLELRTDNTTTVALINKQGTTASEALLLLAKQAWRAILRARLQVLATYLQGELNVEADRASREPKHDYKLRDSAFSLVRRWAPGRLQLDLFASKQSHRLTQWFSREADAMKQPWPSTGCYAFPPPGMIAAVLQRARLLEVRWMLLVTPTWRSAPYWPTLQRQALAAPLWLGPDSVQLEKNTPHIRHPTSAGIWCWLISGRQQQCEV